MKVLASTLTLCAIALTNIAAAKDVENLDAVIVRGSDAVKNATMPRGIFKEVGGSYALENGKTLTITRDHNIMYAELSGMQKTALMSKGNMRFASEDNGIAVQFVPQQTQSLTRVDVSYSTAAP